MLQMTSNPLGEVFEGLMKKFLKSYCVYSGPIDCNVKNHDTMQMTVLMISKSENILKTKTKTNKQNKTKQDKTKKGVLLLLRTPQKVLTIILTLTLTVIFAW